MPSKSEKLEIWRLALEYIDLIYDIGDEGCKFDVTRSTSNAVTSNVQRPTSNLLTWNAYGDDNPLRR